MNKKIIGAIAIVIIVIGIIVTAICDFNANLIYKEHKEVDIYIGKEFDNKEVETLAKEIFDGQEVIVSKAELFEDMANIKTSNITDEQKEKLNAKINEKYGTDNKIEDLVVIEIPRTNGLDLIKPYILPLLISLVLIEVYLVIYLLIYKKNSKEEVKVNIPKSMLELFIATFGIQLVYFSIISITRFPANNLVIPISMYNIWKMSFLEDDKIEYMFKIEKHYEEM